MATQTNKTAQSKKAGLLKAVDVAACKKLAAGAGPHALHAQALLAVHAGSTQAEAARQSGLTPGQVRYWVGKFREHGMAALETSSRRAVSKAKPAKPAAKKGKKAKKAEKKAEKKAAKKARKKRTKTEKKSKKAMKKSSAKKKGKKK